MTRDAEILADTLDAIATLSEDTNGRELRTLRDAAKTIRCLAAEISRMTPSLWAIDYGPSDGIEIFDTREEAMRNANGRPVIAYAVVEEIKQ